MSLGAPPVFTSPCALRGVQTDMSIFSKHLANEVAGRGVRINRVSRAGVLAERMECRMPEGAKRQAAASDPPGRMGQRRPCRRHCTSYRRRRPRSWASPSTLLVASRSLDPRRCKAPVAHRSSYYREPSSQEHSDEPAKLYPPAARQRSPPCSLRLLGSRSRSSRGPRYPRSHRVSSSYWRRLVLSLSRRGGGLRRSA